MTAEPPANPWLSWTYVQDNAAEISRYLVQHASLTVQATVVALLIAVPLAAIAHLRPRLAGLVLGTSGILYTIPSLALFALVYPYLRDRRTTVLTGLVLYALLTVQVSKGRNWARIVTWVVAGLGILGGLISFAQPEPGLSRVLGIIGLLLDIGIVVLLALAPSNQYFKPRY